MRSGLALAAAFSALMLTACETPRHSNTLIFGTNTKVALDVSADQIKQTPSITLGYTRQEAVWMPLMPNVAEEGSLVPCKAGSTTVTTGVSAASQTKTEGPNTACDKFVGTGGDETDTYSVLATFGADFSAGANTNTNGTADTKASGGIAQYFATGIAARTLAAKGGADLVSVRSEKSMLQRQLESKILKDLGITDESLKSAKLTQDQLENEFIQLSKKSDGIFDGDKIRTAATAAGYKGSSLNNLVAAAGKGEPDLRKYLKETLEATRDKYLVMNDTLKT